MNIREYYEDSTGMKPTKKGVALNQGEWRTLKNMFYDVDEKIINAEAEDYNPLELSDKKQIRVTKFKVELSIKTNYEIKTRVNFYSSMFGSSITKTARKCRAKKESR